MIFYLWFFIRSIQAGPLDSYPELLSNKIQIWSSFCTVPNRWKQLHILFKLEASFIPDLSWVQLYTFRSSVPLKAERSTMHFCENEPVHFCRVNGMKLCILTKYREWHCFFNWFLFNTLAEYAQYNCEYPRRAEKELYSQQHRSMKLSVISKSRE